MKKIGPLSGVALFLLCWIGILGQLYEKGKDSKALIYAEIHPETIRFLDSLSNQLDLQIRFDPKIRPDDWKNRHNYGEDERTGLKKIEDKNFIFYFKETPEELQKARKSLKWANEAIPELADLMGKYPYPADVNDRKLPVYLADTDSEFRKLAVMLGSSPNRNFDNVLGFYYSSYSRMGNFTIGILLSPKIWKSDALAQEVLCHEMNHYVYFTLIEYDKALRPYMWVYEGLADYFPHNNMRSLPEKQVEQCQSFTLKTTFPDYIANYWAGESVYWFMEKTYGKEYVRNFIHQTYTSTTEASISTVFGKEILEIEQEWKNWLKK